MVMISNQSRHMDGDEIERYSFGDLPEDLSAKFEEHLLICETCRNRVTASDEMARSMQSAAQEIRRQESLDQESVWGSRWVALLAAAALFLAFGLYGFIRSSARPEVAVSLNAMRGSEPMTQAPARTPLVLNLDLTGLPASASYRLEVVDAAGNIVWRGALQGAKLPPRTAGVYFVRIYTGSELLREYGLRIR